MVSNRCADGGGRPARKPARRCVVSGDDGASPNCRAAGGKSARAVGGKGAGAAGGKREPGDGSAGNDNPGWAIFGYLISGMAVYGGLGWLIGRWAGNTSVCLAIGMLVGLALAITMVIFRYGRH